MTYKPEKRTGGSSLLTQEQKVVPISGGPKDKPAECCCVNGNQPYLLNGIWVRSLSPSCRIHAKSVLKWLGSEPIEFSSHDEEEE